MHRVIIVTLVFAIMSSYDTSIHAGVTMSLSSLLSDCHGPAGAAGAANRGSTTPAGEWSDQSLGRMAWPREEHLATSCYVQSLEQTSQVCSSLVVKGQSCTLGVMCIRTPSRLILRLSHLSPTLPSPPLLSLYPSSSLQFGSAAGSISSRASNPFGEDDEDDLKPLMGGRR